jgi:hypothetical protein
VALAPGAHINDVAQPIQEIVRTEVANIQAFVDRVIRGEFPVC